MKATLFASVVSAAAADSLALTWTDCGGTKHAVLTDVEPTTVELGTETAITGTGSLDKEVSGGTYDMEAKAGAGIIDQHFTGNNCEAKTFNLPLGLGTVSWAGLDCPLAAADSVSIGISVELSASVPASLATANVHMTAVDQDGESVVCADIHIAKQEMEQGLCDGAACPSICACAESSCSSAVDACLADATCASAQSCVLACACGDTACAAGCAVSAGSKATDVLTCLTSSCGGDSENEFLEIMKQGLCDGAACPSICACAEDKCSGAVDACLADSACASAQSCVLACACGDTACAAGCAVSAGSKATDVLTCLTSSCGGESVAV